MWKWFCVVLVATPAFAGPKKIVDASVVLRRTIEDTSSETDSTNSKCVRTKTSTTSFSEQAQVVAAKVPLAGNNFSIPNTKEASLSGQAHYDNPVVIQTNGGNIDITYQQSQAVDMTKYDQPPPPGVKRTGTRKVTTEVSIHLTPSK